MKGKVLALITAVLFGATMVATPIFAASTDVSGTAGTEEKAPEKAKAKKKTAKKKTTKKTTKKKATTAKKTTKKKASKQAPAEATE
jgi:hypothetical protein